LASPHSSDVAQIAPFAAVGPTAPVDEPPISHRAPTWFASAVLLIAVLDLLGWIFYLPLLTSIFPRYATMKPATAVCLGLLAFAVLLKQRSGPLPHSGSWRSRSKLRSIAGSVCAALALPIAFAKMIEFASSRDFGIDRFILRTGAERFTTLAGRMSLGTSVCIVLIACTLVFLDWKASLSTVFLLIGGGLSFSAVIGFLFNAGPLFGQPLLGDLALPTAISLILLQAAVVLLRPEREPYLSLTHTRRSGRTQWLLLGVTVLPAVVALPLLFGMRSGLLDPPFALALLVVVLICIQTLILWQDSKALRQVEGRRKRAEHALLQSEKLAVVGRLAASISHEINNPLEAISNILYLVRNAESLEAAREYALMAEQELGRVAQITTQTLSFYRESRNSALYLPGAVVDSALMLLGGKINSSRVQVKVDFSEDVHAVRCRDGELRQVFVNLLSNAVEATPPGGQIVVRIRSSFAWLSTGPVRGARVSVADSGRGIPAEFRKRIFEPFFTTKAHETGNGLGLWVVQDLVEKQGGTMRMRSSMLPGWQGTTFSIFLPYDTKTPDLATDSEPRQEGYLAGDAAAAPEIG
jgi:signal transduction histidine kinase